MQSVNSFTNSTDQHYMEHLTITRDRDYQNLLDTFIFMDLELVRSPDTPRPATMSDLIETADNFESPPTGSTSTAVYYEEIAEVMQSMEHDSASYISQTPASESGSTGMEFEDINEIVKSMERDFISFDAETESMMYPKESPPHVSGKDATSSAAGGHSGLQTRGPKSRHVGVDRQSLSLVVKTESLHLVGATWACFQITRPDGAVCAVWKHQLPDPALDGAPARFDLQNQPLFSPDWSAGFRGNQPFPHCTVLEIRNAVKVYLRSMSSYYAKQTASPESGDSSK
ncbi:hypothetical protein FIBSPDRAFT_901222 [Athelia psychrophila]|uniref:Uncharacterized protein n=1 Tax=Athelia psychrophila TaxID=1759441 RepID=A0A165XFH1_9AGAM|nr:hypothetical protein FIBSPDRAFT_901222 [Fibularhizoctonia sp. CBS 109695]